MRVTCRSDQHPDRVAQPHADAIGQSDPHRDLRRASSGVLSRQPIRRHLVQDDFEHLPDGSRPRALADVIDDVVIDLDGLPPCPPSSHTDPPVVTIVAPFAGAIFNV